MPEDVLRYSTPTAEAKKTTKDAAKLPEGASSQKKKSLAKEFLTSGTSVAVATAFTHPIDVIKVQQQLHGVGVRTGSKSMLATARGLYRSEGAWAFYRGFEPALIRSSTYGCLRLGLYSPVKDQLLTVAPGRESKPTVLHKIIAGLISGATATAITNPFEVAKVRLQLQSASPSKPSGVFSTVSNIARREGMMGLWKGVVPSMGRAAALTASQVAVYDECKHSLIQTFHIPDGLPLHLASSMMAGVVTTAVTNPFDTVKSRMMAPAEASGGQVSAIPRSAIGCTVMIIRKEGVSGLYKGFLANYARLAPQTAITFVVYEQLRQLAGMSSL